MADQSAKDGPNKWLVAAGLFLLFLIVRCVSEDQAVQDPGSASNPATLMSADDFEPSVLGATPDQASIRRAAGHASRVIGAMGMEGAEFYSEQCEAALREEFSLERRDRCHAFDIFAARLLSESDGFVPARFEELALASRWSYTDDSDTALLASTDRLEALEALVGTIQVRELAPPTRRQSAPPPALDKTLYETLDGTFDEPFGEAPDETG